MSTFDHHRMTAPGTGAVVDPELAFCQHAALCRVALPLRAPADRAWRRDTDAVSVRIEAGSIADPDSREGRRDLPLPAGRLLRLLLLHIFTSALKADSAIAKIGDSIEEVAAAIGVDKQTSKLRELREQLDRLLAARIAIAMSDGRELSVFDARARARVDVWRSCVRLNERFFASLKKNFVGLPRHLVLALQESAPALDAYTWLAERLLRIEAGALEFVPWSEVRQQFGASSQSASASRNGFEASLSQVREAWPEAGFEIGDDGVSLRGASAAAAAEAQPPPSSPPAPAASEIPGHEVAPSQLALFDESDAKAPTANAAALGVEPALPEPEDPISAPMDRSAEPAEGPLSLADAIAQELSTSIVPPDPPPPPPAPNEPAKNEQVGLMPHVTGLSQAVWLRRGSLREGLMIEVTPPGRYDPSRRAVIAIEPIFLLVSGQLHPRELERIAAWAAVNSDLIEGYWTGAINSNDEVRRSVRRVPTRNW